MQIAAESDIEATDLLVRTFNSPECSNPCWLGIEVGVTDKETAIAVLQEHGVEFTLEGYSGDSIWLRHIPGGLFPNVAPEEFTRGGINIGSDGVVTLISFDLDICVSTLVSAYGVPSVWDGILVYLDRQIFFTVNGTTQRIDGIYLHLKDAMPSPDELENGFEYTKSFSETCSDMFVE